MNEPLAPLRLCDGADAGRILGVSRQRVFQLAKSHPLFPPPAARTETGALLWHTHEIREFARVRRPTGGAGHHRRIGLR